MDDSPGNPFRCDSCVVRESSTGSAVILSVTGVLDMLTAPTLAESVDRALVRRPASLIVDLQDVSFLASHGMSVIVAAHLRSGDETEVMVVAEGPATARPLTLVGIADIIAVHSTLDDALAEVAAA